MISEAASGPALHQIHLQYTKLVTFFFNSSTLTLNLKSAIEQCKRINETV